MCLGIPAKIVAITDKEAGLALGETGGVRREINIAMLELKGQKPEELIGQWVLLHVGFAMAVIDQNEARRALILLEQMEQEEIWN